MSFVPRIEIEIQEDESILPVNQTPPCPSVFLFKICVNHSINVLYPTRTLQGFAGVATRICKLLEPVKIGQISTTMYCPLHQFLSHDTAERFFYRALEVFCVPVDQGIEDIATRFSSEIVFMALDASFNRRDIVPVVVEIKSDLWLQYCPGTVEHFIAGYVGRLMERGARVDISSGQLVERIDLKPRSMEQCRICLESLGGEEPALQQPCSHIYHLNCARMWFEDSPSCPLCRIGIDGYQLSNRYCDGRWPFNR
ncbi:hypothetical protein SADUNF_Sadunf03G0110800 [Salix dunnii]|uniref:RING-type E3 ubiquitin transferase n=1 Tax=Salix dunnii TaxID=1413687 RepID=A0A835KF55_9ROSI|nr:hypothetical protein SADUNF_Sadunf03G0110800 [Salix dunnii]